MTKNMTISNKNNGKNTLKCINDKEYIINNNDFKYI